MQPGTGSFLLGRRALEQSLDPALVHPRYAAGEIDHQPLTPQAIRSPRHHHITDEGNGVFAHVELRRTPSRVLVLLTATTIALGFDPPDFRVTPGPGHRPAPAPPPSLDARHSPAGWAAAWPPPRKRRRAFCSAALCRPAARRRHP